MQYINKHYFCFSVLITVLSCQSPSLAQSMTARIEDAQRLIAVNQDFKLHAQQFHTEANTRINEAKKLSTEAAQLKARTEILKDQGKLKGALGQYNADIGAFKEHAGQYAEHLAMFQQQIGECHSDEQQYQLNLEQYIIHCNQFHLPNIQPPHICGTLEVTQEESAQLAHQLYSDRSRMVQAESNLNNAEQKLQNALFQEAGLKTKALSNNRRENEEQSLVSEFARLGSEYKSLEAERQFLAGANTTTEAVHAKLRK